MEDLIEFNKKHADIELPPGYDNQKALKDAVKLNLTNEEYHCYLAKLREITRTKGVDYILDHYDADVIIGPQECFLYEVAAGSGVYNVPLCWYFCY